MLNYQKKRNSELSVSMARTHGIFPAAPKRCYRCGMEAKLLAHHEDYSLPLSISWLCRSCHGKRHDELKVISPATEVEYQGFTHQSLGLGVVDHITRSGLTQVGFADSIGQTRQRIWNWAKDGATVETTETGLKVRAKNGRVLHESQVAK